MCSPWELDVLVNLPTLSKLKDVREANCTLLCHTNTSVCCSSTSLAFIENPGDSTSILAVLVAAIVQRQILHPIVT